MLQLQELEVEEDVVQIMVELVEPEEAELAELHPEETELQELMVDGEVLGLVGSQSDERQLQVPLPL